MISLKPSEMFFDYCGITKDILMKKESTFSFVFFWLISPLLPACILGWYLADLLIINFDA